jgi:hypothetical protein
VEARAGDGSTGLLFSIPKRKILDEMNTCTIFFSINSRVFPGVFSFIFVSKQVDRR